MLTRKGFQHGHFSFVIERAPGKQYGQMLRLAKFPAVKTGQATAAMFKDFDDVFLWRISDTNRSRCRHQTGRKRQEDKCQFCREDFKHTQLAGASDAGTFSSSIERLCLGII